MKSFRLFAPIALLFMSGCALPQLRVFQRNVDPKLAEKPAEQIEAERRAAEFIEQKSAVPEADPVKQLAVIHQVATPLSSSLGEPKKPVAIDDQSKVIADLRAGLVAEQKKTEQWQAFARKYADKPIEGTGINLAGPAGLVCLALVIAACVACPSLGYILLRVLPLLWGFFRRVTDGIGEFAKANPDAGQKLVTTLSMKMDAAHKSLVRIRAARSHVPLQPTAPAQ